jgi:serine protease Do
MNISLRRLLFVVAWGAVLAFPSASWARNTPASFADLAEKLLPSVVNISTTQNVSNRDMMQDFDLQVPEGSPFEEFFHEFMNRQGGKDKGGKNAPEKKHKVTALGSGFVVDPSGLVVTNNHVIQGAEEITVILQDDTNLPAKVVGRDKKTDLALLKVESKKPLPALSWGDSDKSRVGDWIIAIGNPFGLGGTVTAGILSARARDINSGPYDDYLQTDAPINRGNSGGPMFNMDGDVIGVNTAIFSPSGGSIGIGFAIPSSMAKSVIEQLKEHGHTRRGWLGVHIQAVTPEIAEGLALGSPKGALVASITANGPAADAKMEVGDVIVSFDGKDIPDMHRLPRIVAETEVGKTVPMTVVRKGKEVSLRVKVGELEMHDEDKDQEDEDEVQKPTPVNSEKVEAIGINAAPLNEMLRKRYDVKKETKGLVVVSVNPNGLAADKGVQIGDVISEAGQQDVTSIKDLNEAVKKAKSSDKPLLLLVDRKGDLRFIAINFGKKKG